MKFRFQAYIVTDFLKTSEVKARDFAETIGVSEAYVSCMVNGKAGFPASRAHLLPENVALTLRKAAKADFEAAWLAEYRKGLQAKGTSGKAGRHEKQKAKKEKSKTKNRQL